MSNDFTTMASRLHLLERKLMRALTENRAVHDTLQDTMKQVMLLRTGIGISNEEAETAHVVTPNQRYEIVLNMLRDGASQQTCANQFRTTTRTIRRIIDKARRMKDPRVVTPSASSSLLGSHTQGKDAPDSVEADRAHAVAPSSMRGSRPDRGEESASHSAAELQVSNEAGRGSQREEEELTGRDGRPNTTPPVTLAPEAAVVLERNPWFVHGFDGPTRVVANGDEGEGVIAVAGDKIEYQVAPSGHVTYFKNGEFAAEGRINGFNPSTVIVDEAESVQTLMDEPLTWTPLEEVKTVSIPFNFPDVWSDKEGEEIGHWEHGNLVLNDKGQEIYKADLEGRAIKFQGFDRSSGPDLTGFAAYENGEIVHAVWSDGSTPTAATIAEVQAALTEILAEKEIPTVEVHKQRDEKPDRQRDDIEVDLRNRMIFGPYGILKADPGILKIVNHMKKGGLFDIKTLAGKAGLQKGEQGAELFKAWRTRLENIGIEVKPMTKDFDLVQITPRSA